ncbi:MAG: prepilin-type N-terminal cleavage/methylation domain-containing protein [Psychrobacter sp.]|nr:prepilin-type N-terminal cleavage/methylation domain-containing protein [Psychrobacter sp.]
MTRQSASLFDIPRQGTDGNLYHPSPKRFNQNQAGFTLVEILVVVVILSIFAGMISLSVGGSESRKNRAFYEHLIDSLQYVRLLSAERMQPMGLTLQVDAQGQPQPVIMTLTNPYSAYQNTQSAKLGSGETSKNAMELSPMSAEPKNGETPTWQLEPGISLPIPPDKVTLKISSLEANMTTMGNQSYGSGTKELQPWFKGQQLPQVIWFGTGEATPVTIEILYDNKPVGEAIIIEPNGSIRVGQST